MPAKRRKLILGTLGAVGALAGAAAWRYWPEHGVFNPCLKELPDALARHELVTQAWAGVDPARMWDCHAHLVGTGDSGSGIRFNAKMESPLYPMMYAQRLFYLNASCAGALPGKVDATYVERLLALVEGLRPGFKVMLMAFDHCHADDGTPLPAESAFYVPNEYPMAVARRYPKQFEWIASIHPYRRDAVDALRAAAANGARAIKWLPAAMNIDPASKRCLPFYEQLKALDIPVITHGGMERAVHVGDRQRLNNPLALRLPLSMGVRVVVAHCASVGMDNDTDRSGAPASSFDLFTRLMDDPAYGKTLYGDISAVTQQNRVGPALVRMIEREDWHPRLLNGSDYPLPGVMPLFSMSQLAGLGLIEPGAAPVLAAIREHNPLLFDFVLKRQLRASGKRFAAKIFETREFFAK
jgi:hypothetical protein